MAGLKDAEVSSPYPGSRPYRWSETDKLFGRDRELADLCDLVTAYRLTLLYAQSGAGKSSLVAKVGRRLAGEQHPNNAVVLTCRVGASSTDAAPNVFCWSALTSLTFGDEELAFEGGQQPAASSTLLDGLIAALGSRDLVEERGPGRWATTRPCVFVVDQLEELFTTNLARWRDRRGFIEQIAAASKAIADFNILFVIREDYVAQLDPHAPLLPQALRVRYRLDMLRETEAIAAVVRPLAQAPIGIELPEEAARTIVADLLKTKITDRDGEQPVEIQGEFVEPLHLQLACGNLWRVLQDARKVPASAPAGAIKLGELTFRREGETFVASGDAIGDLDDALRATYDKAVRVAASAGRVREAKLRAIVKRKLITRQETRGFIDLATLSRDGVSERAVKELIDARIVRREPRFGSAWLELTHDRLIQPILESNRLATQARTRWLVSFALIVPVGFAIFGARHYVKHTEADEAAARLDVQKQDRFHRELLQTAVSSADVRPRKLTDVSQIGKQIGNMAGSEAPSQSSDALLATIQGQLEKREAQLDELRQQNDAKDGMIRKLETQLPCPAKQKQVGVKNTRHAPQTSSGAGSLVASDVTPIVNAPEVRAGVYNFSIALKVPPDKIDRIQQVTYSFNHPSFGSDRIQTSSDPKTGFGVGYRGWGCLTNLGVDIRLADGTHVPMTIDMCSKLGW